MKTVEKLPVRISKRGRINEGRPSKYSKRLAREICDRISSGESLRTICKDDEMPERKNIHSWLLDDDKREFRLQYNTSCDIRAEILFDSLEEISDNSVNEIVGGSDKGDNARVQARKLQIDTRKWYLAKVLPKKYGDRLDLTSGGDKLPTPILQLNAIQVKQVLPSNGQSATQTMLQQNNPQI